MATTRTFALLAFFLGLVSVAQALDLSTFPACGIKCALQGLNLSDCPSTNQTCLCVDEVYIGSVETCISASCTVKESLVIKNQTDVACGVPPAEFSNLMQYLRAFILVFPTVPIVMRIANKCMKISPWGWDDTTIMIAYLLLSLFTPIGYLSEKAGAGKNIWVLTPEEINKILLIFYVLSLFYMTCLAVIKASILFLYLRIFPETKFRRVLWYTQLVNLLAFIAFAMTTIFSCQPISYFWTGWTKETEGKCINLNAFSEGHGGFNVILDVWMLLLPLSQIYNLNMKLKKKLGIMLMFGIGIFLTVVSAYRLYVLQSFAKSFNVTADSLKTSVWSTIELGVGIFVACLPSARGLWRVVFPKILQMTYASSRSDKSGSKSTENSRQTPRTRSSVHGRARVVSNEESSISELVGEDSNKIPLNDLAQLSPAVTTPSQTSKVSKRTIKEKMVDHIRHFRKQPREEPNEHGDGQSKV